MGKLRGELFGGIAWGYVWANWSGARLGNGMGELIGGNCLGEKVGNCSEELFACGTWFGELFGELLGDMFGRLGRGHGWGMVWENCLG